MPHHQIERAALTDLHADQSNARVHDERNLAAITDSLKQFGQVEPLVVQRGTNRVVGGNGRLQAMRELGWTECDVVRLELSDARATALGIALNRASDLADWDEDALVRLLGDIRDDVDLATLGFDEQELAQLLEEEVEEEEPVHVQDSDPAPSPQDEAGPVVQPHPGPQAAPQVAPAPGPAPEPRSSPVAEPDPTAPSPVRHMAGATTARGNGQMVQFSLDPADAEELHALVDEAQCVFQVEGLGEVILAVMRLWAEKKGD